jgi:site-specific recombinase XerD
MESEEFCKLDVSSVGLDRLSKIRPEDIYDFLFYTNETRKNQWSARSRKLSALRSLYKYLVNKRHYLEYNPTTDLDSPKPKKTLPKVMTLEESEALLDAVENDRESPFRVRDYAIITLFLNCGMRLSELVGISIQDIDRSFDSLKVIGKGSKERIVYLNDACKIALADYLEIRAKYLTKGNDDALFISRLGKRISVKTVQWLVKKYLGEAGLENKNYSTHKLRHTAATLMYQSGNVDIRVLKDILGHEQLNTTQIYTHVSDEGMKNAMSENPLNSDV